MKTKLIAAILTIGISLQAAGMGHPHNLFAARKQMKAKRTVVGQTGCSTNIRLKTVTYSKATLITTAALWNWFNQKSAN